MTTVNKDYYAVLGVARTADEKEIRAAYRRLARKHHPDVNLGDKGAEQRFKEIGEAYEVLSDPAKRKLYDRYGSNWQQAQRMEQQGFSYEQAAPGNSGQRTSTTFDPFSTGGGVGDIGDLFEGLFRGRSGSGASTAGTAQPTRVDVQVTLEEVYTGTKRTLQMPLREICHQCRGAGRVTSTGRAAQRCPACGGQGQTSRQIRAEADIPAGVDTGSQIRISPQGQQVILAVTVLPHQQYRREGSNLHVQANVPLYTALLGGEAAVPTLRKQVSLTIPPETQDGQVFRLAGQGMPFLGDANRKGDEFVTVHVVLPTRLSPQEREMFERLRGMQRS